MTPEQIDRLLELLITLGGKAATEGFAIALRRVAYLAVMDLAWSLVVTVLCGVGLYLAKLCWRKHLERKAEKIHYDDSEWGVGCWAIRVFAVAIWIMVGLSLLQSGLDKLINPEWHAVQMLLRLL